MPLLSILYSMLTISIPRIFNFEDKYFAYSKSKDGEVSCDICLQQVLFSAALPVPQFSQASQCTVQVRVDILDRNYAAWKLISPVEP